MVKFFILPCFSILFYSFIISPSYVRFPILVNNLIDTTKKKNKVLPAKDTLSMDNDRFWEEDSVYVEEEALNPVETLVIRKAPDSTIEKKNRLKFKRTTVIPID